MNSIQSGVTQMNKWSALWFLFYVFATAAFATLLMLRVTGVIDISWWWVFSPVIASAAVPVLIFILGYIGAFITGDYEENEEDGE